LNKAGERERAPLGEENLDLLFVVRNFVWRDSDLKSQKKIYDLDQNKKKKKKKKKIEPSKQ
jgi:hypothetical protein